MLTMTFTELEAELDAFESKMAAACDCCPDTVISCDNEPAESDAAGDFVRVDGCSCSVNSDGSVTDFHCPLHADTDPCLGMSTMTGKRRKGTIRAGRCTNCGWTSRS